MMQNYTIPTSRPEAAALDQADPLGDHRARFALPEDIIYLDGNSLGPATNSALDAINRAANNEWSHGLIRSWNEADWINAPTRIGNKIAPLIGAEDGDVLIADSVTVNLFKLCMAALPLVKRGYTIAVEDDEFPTDQYIAERTADIANCSFVRIKSGEGMAHLARNGGVLIKSIVNYKSAAVAEMADLENCAREAGGVIVWDLSHGTGAIDINVADTGALLATGCTYKFLNGGPGAPAFVYVNRLIADRIETPLPGWMGHANAFAFDKNYEAKPGVARFAAGTPPIVSIAALDGALDVFDGISSAALARKTAALGDLCLERASHLGMTSLSPPMGENRGGHVSLLHDHGYAIVQALIARGVIGDFRAPNIIRFGFSPLFVRFADVWDAMDELATILATDAWDRDDYKTQAHVT